jgi:hypothetical protein
MTDQATDAVRITIETVVDDDAAARWYELYVETFAPLAVMAAARHVLHWEEFLEEMRDPRVRKYVAWSGDRAVGLSTFTNHLDAVPWISPDYFRHHYPEHFERGAIWYVGFTVVDPARRQQHVFQAMIHEMTEVVFDMDAIFCWDVCAFNDTDLSFGEYAGRVLGKKGAVAIEAVDRQTYYVGTFPP